MNPYCARGAGLGTHCGETTNHVKSLLDARFHAFTEQTDMAKSFAGIVVQLIVNLTQYFVLKTHNK